MGGEYVAVRQLVDITHLKVSSFNVRRQRGNMHDVTLRIHFDSLTRPLLCD